MVEEQNYMRRAIRLAKQGIPWASPNPLVGAVIVKKGRVIGEGCHARCGGMHAERAALEACTEDPAGATVYVTLEPCCHQGRQPPCTQALIESGVARVVVGSRDPNPKVAGRGIAQLRAAGVAVEKDFLRRECDALNPVFFHYITARTPYVALKYAMTADGKLAARTGRSQWITGETARAHVHSLRSRYRAILVGVGTLCSTAAWKAGATRCAWCWTAVCARLCPPGYAGQPRRRKPFLYALWKTRKSARSFRHWARRYYVWVVRTAGWTGSP